MDAARAKSAMQIVFIGPPGAGKGTQSTLLANYLKIPKLSTGEMLREGCDQRTDVGRQAAQYMESGRLVPDPLVEKIVLDRLSEPDCLTGYILDGFPRTLPQAANFDRWLGDQERSLSVVIEIRVSEEELLERLAERGRQDDDREIIRLRLKQYAKLTHPLIDYYEQRNLLQVINGVGTTDAIFNHLQQIVDRVG